MPYDADRQHYKAEFEAGRMNRVEYDEHMQTPDDLERLWKRINHKD